MEKSDEEKIYELEKNRKLFSKIQSELTKMVLQDLEKLARIRVEAIVTIHVRQIEIFTGIKAECAQHKLKDGNDFSWQRNMRFYWRKEDEHCQVSLTDVDFTY